MMDKIKLVQKIGNEICEWCGPDRDCGIELEDCSRIVNAINFLTQAQQKDSNEM